MQEKAEQGIWPLLRRSAIAMSKARTEKIIAAARRCTHHLPKLFEWYATGRYSLQEVARKARDEGLVYRRSGCKRTGEHCSFDPTQQALYRAASKWNGKLHQGKHETAGVV